MDIKKLKQHRIIEIIYWLFFLLYMTIKCSYFQFSTELNTTPYYSPVNMYMLLSTFSILVIIMGFITLFFNKRRLTALFILNVLLTTLLVFDTNFYRYYYTVFTIPVILQLDFRVLSSVNDSIMSLFNLKDFMYLLDLPIMLAIIIWMREKVDSKIAFSKKAVTAVILIAIGFLAIIPVYTNTDIKKFSNNNSYILRNLGVFYFHYHNTKSFIKENVFESDNLTADEQHTLKNYFNDQKSDSDNYKGIAKGKNLIILQIEALQNFVINRKINGREITPNLNKLINKSLFFNNFYYQIAGGNTSDAEFLCNNSLYPAKEGGAYMRFDENTYYSLPKLLKNKGYDTYVMHPFQVKIWNRESMYKALGFDTFADDTYYEMDDFAGWDGTALSDSSFLRQSVDDVIDTDNPFYSFIITLSSHHPFSAFEDYDFDVGEYQGTYIGNYIKSINYADQCIGEFIQNLKNKGLWENSLFVLYGDHSAVPKYLSDDLMGFIGKEFTELEWIKQQKVPLIVHYPGLKNGEVIETVSGQIDIMPTVANLMDLEAPFTMGKDLLNTEKSYAIFRNGSVVTDEYYYFNDYMQVFDMNTGNILDTEKYRDEIDFFHNELHISDLILEKDALRAK